MPYLEKLLKEKHLKTYLKCLFFVLLLLFVVEMLIFFFATSSGTLTQTDIFLMKALPLSCAAVSLPGFSISNLTGAANRKGAYSHLTLSQLSECDAELMHKNLFAEQVTATKFLILVNRGNYNLKLIPVCEIRQVKGPVLRKNERRGKRNLWAYIYIKCGNKKYNCTIKKCFSGAGRENLAQQQFMEIVTAIATRVNNLHP